VHGLVGVAAEGEPTGCRRDVDRGEDGVGDLVRVAGPAGGDPLRGFPPGNATWPPTLDSCTIRPPPCSREPGTRPADPVEVARAGRRVRRGGGVLPSEGASPGHRDRRAAGRGRGRRHLLLVLALSTAWSTAPPGVRSLGAASAAARHAAHRAAVIAAATAVTDALTQA
jgi:hypothetical protein